MRRTSNSSSTSSNSHIMARELLALQTAIRPHSMAILPNPNPISILTRININNINTNNMPLLSTAGHRIPMDRRSRITPMLWGPSWQT
jgi:hypothetical protein